MLTKCPVNKQRLLHGIAEILFNIRPLCNTLIIISTKYTSFQEIFRNLRKLSKTLFECCSYWRTVNKSLETHILTSRDVESHNECYTVMAVVMIHDCALKLYRESSKCRKGSSPWET